MTLKISILRGLKDSRVGPKVQLDIHPEEAARNKAKRAYLLHAIQIPILRVLGFGFLSLVVLLHNRYVLEDFLRRDFIHFLFMISGYCIWTWIILYFFYDRVKKVDLGVLFLTMDICVYTVAIYYSGAEKSLLFFLLCIRVADQTATFFKRALLFAHIPIVCYLLMLLYVSHIEGRQIVWSSELVKLTIVYSFNIYLSLSARPAEQIRNRTRASMKLARELITELDERTKQMEIARKDAVAANRAKSEFLANMSHELRTPLNHVIGFTELLLGRHFGKLNESQNEHLTDIYRSSKHLLSLIQEILDLSKIEAGKMELEFTEVDLDVLLKDSLSMVREKAIAHHIRICLEPTDLPGTVTADERKVKQILYNLLSNAVKFTPDGGEVVLKAWTYNSQGSAHQLDLKGSESGVVISVADTGIGIRQEDMERIFSPFEQADNSPSRRYQGTGLGLSLTRKLVELHGGRIWLESEGEGKGSVFCFTLPLKYSAQRAA